MRLEIKNNRGMTRAAAILLILVLILAVICCMPLWKSYQIKAERVGCESSLHSANRQLLTEYLLGKELTADSSMEIVKRAMDGWEDLCPAGGTPYLVKREGEIPYEVVCGLHDPDEKERARLNASYTAEQLREIIEQLRLQGELCPEKIMVELNGKSIPARLTEEKMEIRRETSIYFSVKGYGAFTEECDLPEGSLCYVSYADGKYYADWSVWSGWTGDCYEERGN